MLECLRRHRDELSPGCRFEELHLNIIQARDVRLRPKLRKICAHEMATHCKDVKPGALPNLQVVCGYTLSVRLLRGKEGAVCSDIGHSLGHDHFFETGSSGSDPVPCMIQSLPDGPAEGADDMVSSGAWLHSVLPALACLCVARGMRRSLILFPSVPVEGMSRGSLLLLCAGQGRVFQCLQEHLAEVDFSAACREQVGRLFCRESIVVS